MFFVTTGTNVNTLYIHTVYMFKHGSHDLKDTELLKEQVTTEASCMVFFLQFKLTPRKSNKKSHLK